MKFFSDRSIKLVKLYSWNTIFFKYFKKSIIYILLPLALLSSAICYYSFRSSEEDMINTQSRAFYQTTFLLESVFKDVENHHSLLSQSSDITGYCALAEECDTDDKFQLLLATQKQLKNASISSQYINNVHLYKLSGDYVLSTLNGNYLDKFHIRKWYDIYTKDGISEFVCYEDNGNYAECVLVVKGIQRDGHLYGIIVYEISASTFNDIFEKNGFTDNAQLIYDKSGKIFYSDNPELIETNVTEVHDKIHTFKSFTKSGKDVFFKSSLNYTYNFVSKANIYKSVNLTAMISIIIGLMLFVLLISFVLSFYLSLQFYQSIIEIATTLRNDEDGNGEISQSKYDELYYINSHIVSRLTKTEKIEKNLTEQIIALKKAQFVALQTQLNPHFIYNTLNLINVMIMNLSKKECDASRAVVILSQLLREMLDTKKYLVSLKDEIEYTKKYIELQQLKHSYTINVVFNVDETLCAHKVLKFMLQPIVENAFEHGFDRTLSDSYNIEISAIKEDNLIKVIVSNDGKEIEPDVLKTIQDGLKSDMIFEQKGIGLMNVNHRIRIIYGDEFGCSIDSNDKATTVHITLPDDESGLDFSSDK